MKRTSEIFLKPCLKKTAGALRRCKRGSEALVAYGMLPRLWGARGARSSAGLPNSMRCPMILLLARCGALVPVEKKSPAQLAP